MYLENAQRVFHAILHHSTVMQGSLFGIVFIGLLADLPAISRQVVTPPYGPIGAVDSPKSSQISR